MGEEVRMTDYCGGGGGGDDVRVLEWEVGLPGGDVLTPLSQALIPPELASAFSIKPEPGRTSLEVNRASQSTLSSIRGETPELGQNGFESFSEKDNFRAGDLIEIDEDRSESRKLRRVDSMEEEAVENSNSAVDDQSGGAARTLKRPRLVWTPQLHKRFVDVVAHLGIKNAVPKTIMQLMNVEGLTRENVASHLQKYRLYLKRMQGLPSEGGSSSSAGDQLFASTPIPQNLSESGSSGHGNVTANGNGHVGMPIPMPYGAPPMMPMPMIGMGMAHHHQLHGNGHGHMGLPAGNYNGFESHHYQPYGMMQQQRDWSGNNCASVVNSYHHHVAPNDK
ncbi:PHO85 cyclin-1 [Ancistrocladus abbreviatus]